MTREAHSTNGILTLLANALEATVEVEVLVHGEGWEQRVKLRTEAQLLVHLGYLRGAVVAIDAGFARAGRVQTDQHGHGCRLAGAVVT